jgi:hypothetical protein
MPYLLPSRVEVMWEGNMLACLLAVGNFIRFVIVDTYCRVAAGLRLQCLGFFPTLIVRSSFHRIG